MKPYTTHSRTAKDDSLQDQSSLKDMHDEIAAPDKNPFRIRAISKPLIPETQKTEEKVLMKPSFQELSKEEGAEDQITTQISGEDLDIKPYRPLRFRAP